MTKVKHGVRQGSILGPLLFRIYINDIVKSSPKLEFLLFADDTSIFLSHRDPKELRKILNIELCHVSDWLKSNKLSLNVAKSNFLHFRNKNDTNNQRIKLFIDKSEIEEKEFAKYLGIIIDNKLTFAQHIDYLETKLNKGNAIIAKLRHFSPETVVRNLYFAHIQSHLNYGLLIWGNAAITHLNKLKKSQEKAIKIMTFKNKHDIVVPRLFKNVDILPMNFMKSLNSGLFIWKIQNNILPNCTLKLPALNGVNKNPRDSLKLIIPFRNTEFGKRTIFYIGIKEWNKIPNEIKSLTSLNLFKKNYKKYLITNLTK